jgi:hypothetical protein
MGITGWSKVTGLYQSYVDTRVASFESEGNYCYRPIASRLNGECQGGTRAGAFRAGLEQVTQTVVCKARIHNRLKK